MKCDYCGSENVHVGNRGFSILTGFIGSSQLIMTCLDCGYKKRASKTPKQTDKDRRLGGIIMFSSAVFSILVIIIILGALGVL